jgi:hypothetical protein
VGGAAVDDSSAELFLQLFAGAAGEDCLWEADDGLRRIHIMLRDLNHVA